MNWMPAGISIGIIVGAISGLILLAIIRTLATTQSIKSIATLIGELTGLAAFLVTANYLGSSVLFKEDELILIRDSYLVSLMGTIVAMVLYPIYRLIVKYGKELGESGG